MVASRPIGSLDVARVVAVVCTVVLLMVGWLAPAARGHGEAAESYEVVIRDVEPTVPVKVSIEGGDRIRFENVGDGELVLCGYTAECENYVRIGPDGVFENVDSEAYFANLDEDEFAPIPDGAGDGEPKFERVRKEPLFFAYHDHRLHWMGSGVPPNVDEGKSGRQKVTDWKIDFRYDGVPASVTGDLYYTGGRPFLERWGELLLTVAGIAGMFAVFVADARRRRRARERAAGGAEAPAAEASAADG